MGEAKTRRLRALAASSNVALKLHITDREAWALSLHLLHNFRAKTHQDQTRFVRAIEELGLQSMLDVLFTPQGASLTVSEFKVDEFEMVTLARDTADFVLEQTNMDMSALHALCLAGFVARLKDAKDGRYTPPALKEQDSSDPT